jgi:hypothetical protein
MKEIREPQLNGGAHSPSFKLLFIISLRNFDLLISNY